MRPEHVEDSLRDATPADAPAVAALHARSWRATYRGSFSDAYLDGPVEHERAALWRGRFLHPRAGQVVVVMDGVAGSGLAGFACAFIAHDPHWGTLIDNLHVDPALKGGGRGRKLMRGIAQALTARPSPHPVYLTVLSRNEAARSFYARIGGAVAEQFVDRVADGSRLAVHRIVWPSARTLLDGTA